MCEVFFAVLSVKASDGKQFKGGWLYYRTQP